MKIKKATRSQVRKHNRQLILRALHTGLADNRAALALETGLAKPTVSDLISELIDDGFLIETGHGKSTETGGKRPRLLEFVPNARHVIGVSVSEHGINGLLTDLNGNLLAEHQLSFEEMPAELEFAALAGVINGLVAQLDAPLLCIGVGVPGHFDLATGVVEFDDYYQWSNMALHRQLQKTYDVPAYIGNNTELTAIAQYAFEASQESSSLVAVLINSTVAIGYVLGETDYYSGRNIGWLKQTPDTPKIDHLLGWKHIKRRVAALQAEYPDSLLIESNVSCLDIRYGVANNDELALLIHNEIEDDIATLLSWVIALLRPDHIALSGTITDLGQTLLDRVRAKLDAMLPPKLLNSTYLSLALDSNLSARGAIAYALQKDLGLIQWHNISEL